MSHLFFRIGLPVALLSVGVGVLVALGRRPLPQSRDDSGADQRPVVTTAPVTLHEGGLDLAADGIVVPYREITVAAEVSGVVVYKSDACNEGSYVKKGTELITIDPRDYQLEVRRLKGELAQADINLQELNVELENAQQLVPLAERELALRQSQLERIIGLRVKRVVSQEEVEEAERSVLASRNALLEQKRARDALRTRQARLESAIEVGKVQLEQAELNKSRTTVVAPVDGVIIRDDVEQDGYVQKGAALFSIEDTNKVEVRCNLRMEELRWVWRQATPPSSAGLTLPVEENQLDLTNYHKLPPTDVTVAYELGGHVYTWHGVLDRYDGFGLDEQTRMVPCRIVVDDPQPGDRGWEGEVDSRAALARPRHVCWVDDSHPPHGHAAAGAGESGPARQHCLASR